MSINLSEFNKLNQLVSLYYDRKMVIVLDPSKEYCALPSTTNCQGALLPAEIKMDKVKWSIPLELKNFVSELAKNNEISSEEKILVLYEKLCRDYTYDDNVLSYRKKSDDNKYFLPDWYGRDVDSNWEENRIGHNKRVCYEIARILAESLFQLLKKNKDYNIAILWDVDNVHYFVGLICDKYALTLDLDDYDQIKDLTRVKTGLSIRGIQILEDEDGEFKKALKEFNKERAPSSIDKFEELTMLRLNSNVWENGEHRDITFFKKVFEVLNEQELDSAGVFEYMKEIVNITVGSPRRQNVWKKLPDNKYTRCIVVSIDSDEADDLDEVEEAEKLHYLIDVDERIIRPFSEEEFRQENPIFIPVKDFSRSWDEKYDGR